MATVEETFERSRGDDSASRSYLVREATSESAARTAALSGSPASVGGYSVKTEQVSELGEGGSYEAVVTWSSGEDVVEPSVDGDESFSFEVSPASYMVYQSRATVAVYPNSAATPRYKGAINVDEEGNVNGVQWPPSPTQTFVRTATVAATSITQGYYRTLSALAGKVNDAVFEGFAAGELLFLGASGQRQNNGPWQIAFKFGFSENKADLVVGDETGIAKKGWEYLWAAYRTVEHSNGTDSVALVQTPLFAYVEQIAEEASFSGLNP